MTPYERFQLATYGNILPGSDAEPDEHEDCIDYESIKATHQ